MIKPLQPANEETRLATLRALNILDTAPDERFDRLTRLARRLFGVPIALVSLIDADRQWFKSASGLAATETPRDISFCGHAILGDRVFMVPDAAVDERFHDNPLVTGATNVRFYAGCPLQMPGGSRLGTLCLIDHNPRDLDAEELDLLTDLARMAETELAAVQLATIDDLTQLSNRRGFMGLAQQALRMCRRLQKPAGLLFFDLDGFKAINDRFGHAEGDHALGAFAALLKKVFRDSDVIGRLGGDEFTVFLTNTNEAEAAAALVRLGTAVDTHNLAAQRDYTLRYSVGTTLFDKARHETVESLVAEADERMYEHKRRQARTDNNAATLAALVG